MISLIFLVSFLINFIAVQSTDSATGYPFLTVRGNHYECGYQIGARFKDRITEFFKVDNAINNVLVPFYNTPKGKELFDQYARINQAAYPQFYDEVLGYSLGSGVPLYKVLLANFGNEMGDLAPNGSKVVSQRIHCSDVHVVRPDAALLAHNEDSDPDIKSYGYFVEYYLKANASAETHHFVAFHYPGHLPGNTFGFNDHIVFSTNDVEPTPVLVGRVRAFLGRSMMTAKTIREVLDRIVAPNRAFGFSLNVGVVADRQTYNIELAPTSYAFTEVKENFTHFNMYKVLQIQQLTDISTLHRQKRADQLPLASATDGLNVLGDNQDKSYPIYRDGVYPDANCATVATILFDLHRKVIQVWNENPKYNAPIFLWKMP